MAAYKQFPPSNRGEHSGKDRFRCYWKDSAGKQKSFTVYSRKEAERFCKDFKQGFINPNSGSYLDVEVEQSKKVVREKEIDARITRTFRNLAEKFLTKKEIQGKSASTLEGYKQQLKVHIYDSIGDMPIIDIGLEQIEKMVESIINSKRKRKIGPRTINKCLTLASSIFKYGIKHKWCTDNPAHDHDRLDEDNKRIGRVIEPHEMWRILGNMEHPYDVAMQILMFTSCRRGEGIALKWKDIDFVSTEISIERSFKTERLKVGGTKTKKRRTVPMSAHLTEVLRRYAASQGEVDPEDWLFPDTLGKQRRYKNQPTGDFPISGAILLNRFKVAQKKSGLSELWVHDMRHTACSLMSDAGVGTANATSVSGHKDKATYHNKYAHEMKHGAQEAVDVLESALLEGRPPSDSANVTMIDLDKAARS